MEIDDLAAQFMAVLEEHKAVNPEILRLEASFTDAMILVTATSRRHAQGIADAIAKLCHEQGYELLGIEGYDHAEWILVDCNNIIVNIFLEETRDLYKLEELWRGAARSGKKEIKS